LPSPEVNNFCGKTPLVSDGGTDVGGGHVYPKSCWHFTILWWTEGVYNWESKRGGEGVQPHWVLGHSIQKPAVDGSGLKRALRKC